MKKDTLVNFRINQDTKEEFQTIVENNGYTMSQVVEAFMLDIIKRKIIPINIRVKIEQKREKTINIPFIKKCIDEIIANINDNDKIKTISLFGSYSNGTAKSNSDVDLFLDVEDSYTLFELADLQIKLESKLGKKVDLVTKSDDAYFMNHIQKEKIQLYERRS